MKQTGEVLKKAREEKGITLQEVSAHLKITSRVLKALEDGDMSQLPGKTFVRGFVQSYGAFLKMDLKKLMQIFHEELSGNLNPETLASLTAVDEDTHTKSTQAVEEESKSNKTTDSVKQAHQVQHKEQGPDSENNPENHKSSHQDLSVKSEQVSIDATSAKQIDEISQVNRGEANAQGGARGKRGPAALKQGPTHHSGILQKKIKVVNPEAPALAVDPNQWSKYSKLAVVIFIVSVVSIIVLVRKTVEKYEREKINPALVESSMSDNNNKGPAEKEAPQADLSSVQRGQLSGGSAGLSLQQQQGATAEVPREGSPEVGALSSATAETASVSEEKKPLANAPIEKKPQLVTATAPPDTVKPNGAEAAPVVLEKKEVVAGELKRPSDVVVSKPQELIIEALDAVEVEYQIDGGGVQKLKLSAQQIHTFKAKSSLRFNLSDGGAVSIIHNGKAKGVPGVLGQSLKLQYP